MSLMRWIFDHILPEQFQRPVARAYYRRQFQGQTSEADALACRSYFKPGDLVIDVGANVGDYTRVFSENGAIVHALEPIPETFDYLVSNVSGSRLKNVIFYNIAASSENGMAKMTIPKWHGGGKNIYEARLCEDGDIPVCKCRLDDVFSNLNPTFIKCDVEGHELEVIRGAVQLIERCHPKWLIEVSGEETVQLMKQLGYSTKPATGSNVFFV
ncbi:MAG: FkbM family methyltransferase [Terriglobia bacterium]|nr:FkbM family methyltransferase [Terriglobia bacterium]